MTPLDAALAYAVRGYRVLAIEHGTKRPLASHFPNGVKSATTDRALLRDAFEAHPDAGLGLAIPDDLAVLDVDRRNGGHVTLAELTRKHGVILATPEQVTASLGSHYVFYRPKGVDLRTKLGRGIELLGSGRYIVTAPTVLVVCRMCGRAEHLPSCSAHKPRPYRYEWRVRLSRVAPAELPDWIVELARILPAEPPPLVRRTGNAVERVRAYIATMDPAISGSGGHSQTFKVACVIVGNVADEATQFALLADYNQRCQPPWSKRELEHKLADARKKHPMPLPDRPLPERRSA